MKKHILFLQQYQKTNDIVKYQICKGTLPQNFRYQGIHVSITMEQRMDKIFRYMYIALAIPENQPIFTRDFKSNVCTIDYASLKVFNVPLAKLQEVPNSLVLAISDTPLRQSVEDHILGVHDRRCFITKNSYNFSWKDNNLLLRVYPQQLSDEYYYKTSKETLAYIPSDWEYDLVHSFQNINEVIEKGMPLLVANDTENIKLGNQLLSSLISLPQEQLFYKLFFSRIIQNAQDTGKNLWNKLVQHCQQLETQDLKHKNSSLKTEYEYLAKKTNEKYIEIKNYENRLARAKNELNIIQNAQEKLKKELPNLLEPIQNIVPTQLTTKPGPQLLIEETAGKAASVPSHRLVILSNKQMIYNVLPRQNRTLWSSIDTEHFTSFERVWEYCLSSLCKEARQRPSLPHFWIVENYNLTLPNIWGEPIFNVLCGLKTKIPHETLTFPSNVYLIFIPYQHPIGDFVFSFNYEQASWVKKI